MCCKLCGHCSKAIPLLLRLAELVQCIKCGGDDYFIWIFLFFFAYTSLPSSSVFVLLVQVALLNYSRGALAIQAPWKVCLFIFPPRTLIHVLGQDWYVSGPSSLLKLGPRVLFHTRVLPLPHNQLLNIHLLLKREQLEDNNPLNIGQWLGLRSFFQCSEPVHLLLLFSDHTMFLHSFL